MQALSDFLARLGVDPLIGGLVLGFIGGWLFARILRGGDAPRSEAPTTPSASPSAAPPAASPLALSALRTALRDQGVDAELNPAQAGEVLALLKARQKLEAIKLLRSFTGLGLRETKDACDQVERDQGWAG
jgi:hypothetical protein